MGKNHVFSIQKWMKKLQIFDSTQKDTIPFLWGKSCLEDTEMNVKTYASITTQYLAVDNRIQLSAKNEAFFMGKNNVLRIQK